MAWTGTSVVIDCVKSVLNTILHQSIAVILVYSTWGPLLIGGQLSWHVILCTLGLFPFMAEALILFGGENVWTVELDRGVKIWMHFILMVFGIVFTIAGIAFAIDTEVTKSAAHFSTTHGAIGLVFLVFVFLSIVIGLFARFSKTFKGYLKPAVLLLTHNIIGILTYIFAIASLCTGYHTNSFDASEQSKIAAIVVCSIICVWSLLHSFVSLYKQIRLLM